MDPISLSVGRHIPDSRYAASERQASEWQAAYEWRAFFNAVANWLASSIASFAPTRGQLEYPFKSDRDALVYDWKVVWEELNSKRGIFGTFDAHRMLLENFGKPIFSLSSFLWHYRQQGGSMGRAPVKSTEADEPKLAIVDLSGPLPPAAELERIEKLQQGATDRIIALVEKQQAHRMEWETKVREAHAKERLTAQLCALTFALCGLATALVLGILNQPTAATVIGSTTIGGVVASFILGVRGGLPQEKTLLRPVRP